MSFYKYVRLAGGIFFLGLAATSAFAQSSPFDSVLRPKTAESDLPQAQAAPGDPSLSISSDPRINPFIDPDTPAAPDPKQVEQEIREQAFNAAITGLMPMEPHEIRRVMERYDRTRQAVEIPIYPYPEPEIAATTISLDPGSKPIVVKVAVGHVTTLSMLDITGEPWPIHDVTWAGNFEMETPDEGSNIIRIIPMSDFTYGNVSMRLVQLRTPVSFILKTSRDSVHYRLDARVPEFGPQAEIPLIEGGLTLVAGNPVINAILDGVPPDGAERLEVKGADSRTTAYRLNMNTYVRTPLTLLSPGWSSSVSSADGMNVYTLANAPVVLLSDKGQVVRAYLSEKGPQDE